MNNYDIIIHLAYLITFVALSIKDVLFLRIVLSFACFLQVIYQFGFNDNPDIVNSNPFDEGWMLKLQISNMDENLNLMNAEKYKTFIS